MAEIAYSVRGEDRMTPANKHESATESDEDAGSSERESPLQEGLDYYLENGLVCFHCCVSAKTRLLLRKRLPPLSLSKRRVLSASVFSKLCQLLHGFFPHMKNSPVSNAHSAKSLVEPDCRFVPVEHAPFHAIATALVGSQRQRRK